ncbi:MAG: glycosyltransferase [Desulfamplus sp.]|nr:glycosyltransferase [Desulfamplus sp.]
MKNFFMNSRGILLKAFSFEGGLFGKLFPRGGGKGFFSKGSFSGVQPSQGDMNSPHGTLHDTPREQLIKQWASSEWIEYQAWIFQKEFMTLHRWMEMREISLAMEEAPLITVVTPVYNTDPADLKECLASVRLQAYHNWEMCIVDDGSTNESTLAVLRSFARDDSRIRVIFSRKNQGICGATNRAMAAAAGSYIAFLDHDDRLALDALFHVARVLVSDPGIDVVYSDRDMLSPRGLRFMHLFKPDWSPELLFSMNYICHLMVYRASLIWKVGGLRSKYEGSQDYDLILRVMEWNPRVHHISRVLYHWRQNENSVALNHDAKTYAYRAGVLALTHALERRGLKGRVSELSHLWRGHYRVELTPPGGSAFFMPALPGDIPGDAFAPALEDAVTAALRGEPAIVHGEGSHGIGNHGTASHGEGTHGTGTSSHGTAALEEFIVVLSPLLSCGDKRAALLEMISWFQIPEVGIVTGKIVTAGEKPLTVHAGMVQKPDGMPLFIFDGKPESLPGYMAATFVVRNVIAPHPCCFAVRKSLWLLLRGIDSRYKGGHGVTDLALRALKNGFRTVYTPFARFEISSPEILEDIWRKSDIPFFKGRWDSLLSLRDPYYNRYLTLKLVDMGLDADVGDMAAENGNHIFNIA